MASVQNEYSLLCRQFDSDWAELSSMENMPLLAFSPLACGLLTGKYANGRAPQGSRLSIAPALGGRMTAQVFQVVDAYLDLAKQHGLAPNQMALAFLSLAAISQYSDFWGNDYCAACLKHCCG